MEIKLNIDVESAKADYEIIQKFGRLLEDFDRLKNLVLYKEIERTSQKESFFKDFLDAISKEECNECKNECKKSNDVEIKEIKSLDDLKEMLGSIFK